ncbi:MAG: Uma2 family endonuclease [Aquificaceae bacterium]|nr:Uma2 family endonuclease [Aquificaceae bacterium]
MKVVEKRYTVEDYEKLPEGSPYQLIEGELVMSPASMPYHQMVSGNIYVMLRKNLGGKALVLYAPVDVYLSEDSVYQPDLVVLLSDSLKKLTHRGVEGAPDIAVEILSVSTAYYDLVGKKEAYERAGVKEYWIVDPLRRSFEVYQNTEEGFKLISKAKVKGKVRSGLLEFDMELSEVFEGVEL